MKINTALKAIAEPVTSGETVEVALCLLTWTDILAVFKDRSTNYVFPEETQTAALTTALHCNCTALQAG